MFEGFSELDREHQFIRLVQPRSDWFEPESIELGLARILSEFTRLGIILPDSELLLAICREHELCQHVRIRGEKRGISKLKGEYPQHAGIVELGRQTFSQSGRYQLAALVLFCIDEWTQKVKAGNQDGSDHALLERRIEHIWRQIRRISDEGIKRIPPVIRDVKGFYDSLDDVIEDLDPREQEALAQDFGYLREIRRFFNFYLGGGRVYTRSSRESEKQLTIESTSVRITPMGRDRDSDIEAECLDDELIISRRSLTQARDSEHYLNGNALDEIEDGPRILKMAGSISLGRGGSPQQVAIRLAHRKVHLRRSSQLLPGRWNTLGDTELKDLLTAVLTQTAGLNQTSSMVVLLMLLTGREFDTVFGANVVKQMDQLPKERADAESLYLVADNPAIAVQVQAPQFRRRAREGWKKVLQAHQGYLHLPVLDVFWEVLRPLTSQRASNAKKRSVKLFAGQDAAEIDEQIRALLNSINRGRKGRLTVHRIAYQLTEELHYHSGDLIEALLITGRQPPYGTSAALYYHHCNRQKLIDHYVTVTERWQKLLSPRSVTNPQRQKELIDGSVGSNLVPETRIIAGMFRALRQQIEYDRSLLGTGEGLRFLHNSLTDYVLMMLFWLTGYRAVQDPVASVSEYNPRRRMLVIADKTGEGYGHSRMVPVCQILAEQIAAYQLHTRWLQDRLRLANRHNLDTMFFFLDEDFNALPVRPASMEAFLRWAYVLPLNLNRHWLRGELRRHNVPGPYVDRFMGHWSMGQEPWGRFSAVDPVDFHDVLDGALGLLAGELDLQIVGGVA